MMKKALYLAALGAPMAMFAEETNDIQTLWGKLNINFTTIMGNCLETLATPLVVVIGVAFVLTILWACVSYGKKVFNRTPRG